MSRIRLTIDALTLRGFEPAEGRAVAEELRSELARLLADPAVDESARSHRTPVLRMGRIPIETGPAGGRKFGRRVAQGIAKGLKP
jgi:hypothetical protein